MVFLIAETLGMSLNDVLRMSVLEYHLWLQRFSVKVPFSELFRQFVQSFGSEGPEEKTEKRTFDDLYQRAMGE